MQGEPDVVALGEEDRCECVSDRELAANGYGFAVRLQPVDLAAELAPVAGP
jgi:hypothetical protein